MPNLINKYSIEITYMGDYPSKREVEALKDAAYYKGLNQGLERMNQELK